MQKQKIQTCKENDLTRFELAPSRLTVARGYPSGYYFCTVTNEPIFCIYVPPTTHSTFRNRNFEKNTNLHQLSCHEARTAKADPGRVGRAEQGEARPGSSAPMDLSSSNLEGNSTSGLNRSLWLLSCNLWIILQVFILTPVFWYGTMVTCIAPVTWYPIS